MAHITNKLRGLVAALVAVFAALALVPGVAMADTLAGKGGLTVGPFAEDVRVDIYRVVKYTADTKHGTYDWKFADGLSIDGYDGLTADSAEMKAAAGKMATWARQQTPTDTKDVSASGSAEFTGLEPGQYLILVTATGENSNTIYQNMVADLRPTQDRTTGDWTIDKVTVSEIKASNKPVIDKNVTGAEDDSDETDEYKVGDWVPYTITANIPVYPNDQWANTTFKITDVMSKGLTAPESTDAAHYYKVQINGEDASSYLKTPITVTKDDSGITTAVFDFNYEKLAAAGLMGEGNDVTITYSARINDNVKVIEGASETNDATLEFGQTPNIEESTDKVTVDTYAISILKTDEDTQEELEGAVFGVYSDAGCEDQVGTITTGENGVGFLAGLKAGTYYVKEITAPTGYQLDSTVHTVTVPGAGDDNNVNLDITNKGDLPGLPTTGGAGTVALTAAGVVLIAGAAAFIVRSRKQN